VTDGVFSHRILKANRVGLPIAHPNLAGVNGPPKALGGLRKNVASKRGGTLLEWLEPIV
jgi:hypothetical protein